jgi:hypothetical protein
LFLTKPKMRYQFWDWVCGTDAPFEQWKREQAKKQS